MSGVIWRPFPGAQTRFMASPAFEAFYGGAAYPGKTEALVMEGLRQIDNPRYNAVFFRRTYPMLEGADGPIARSKMWFPLYGGRYNETKHFWIFPSGAHYFFRHLENIKDLDDYQGQQYQYVAFDELGQFLEQMYIYLFSRCRADPDTGLRAYIRAAGNPGGYHWVKRRFPKAGVTNKIGYFTRINNKDVRVDKNHPLGRSRTFIPATHRDNPKTTQDYIATLAQMDFIDKARLSEGDWDIEDSTDLVYPDFSMDDNVTEEAEYDPRLGDVFWSVDDGYAYGKGKGSESYHPRVVLLWQKTPLGGCNIFAERYATGESDYNICLDDILGDVHGIKKGWDYPRPSLVFIDSSAVMFKGAIMQRDITVNPSTHDVIEGIRNTRRFIKDFNGMRLMKMHPRCENVAEEFLTYRFGESNMSGGGERKPIKADDHGPDAIRYGLWHMRIPEVA